MFAKFSPDGTRVGYVRANNIYVERLDDGKTIALTTDGSETTINGTSDWVYEEELDLRDGVPLEPRRPPDRLLAVRLDRRRHLLAHRRHLRALPEDHAHPLSEGRARPTPLRASGSCSAAGGPTTWIKAPGDPREHYLARLDWIDADTVAIQQLNRLQNQNDFLLGRRRDRSR